LEGRKEYRVFYADRYIVVSPDLEAVRFGMPPPELYVFPPINISSYLFFRLNPSAIKTVEDFIKKHAGELPSNFESSLSTYAELDRSVGSVSELPGDVFMPQTINNVELTTKYLFFNRKLRKLRVDYEIRRSDFIIPDAPIIIYEKIELEISRKRYSSSPYYVLYVRDVPSFLYVASVAGIRNDIEKVFELMETLKKELNRGALLLSAMKKLEEV